jgi:hypothetical protein
LEQQQTPNNIARKSTTGKHTHANVPVHGGMVTRSRATGVFHMGADALSRADASAANPLDKTAPGKTFAPAAPVIGQRSRSHDTAHGGRPGENHMANCGRGCDHDLGARILDEAFAASADDRMAHGRK